jgi:transposase
MPVLWPAFDSFRKGFPPILILLLRGTSKNEGIPEHWKAVHQRFGRWAKSGVFERIFKLLAEDHDNEYMMIDATIVRAHQHSAGARKKTERKPSADPAAGQAPKSRRSPTR